MLLSLHIENVAIIEKSDIDFSGGFNVLTGETGAGKSIIIDSINLLLGNKSSREMISSGKDFAFVSAAFTGFNNTQLDFLKENDVFLDDDSNLIISRKITKDGRSVSKINGQNVTVSTLKNISSVLVGIFGQHDGSKILDCSTHIEYLDEYCKNADLICSYKKIYSQIKDTRNRIQKLTEIKNDKDNLVQSLNYQIDEIEKAKITIGEFDKLKLARSQAQHSALISQTLYNSEIILSDDTNGVIAMVSNLVAELERLKGIVGGVDEVVNNANSAMVILQDISQFVSSKSSDIDEENLSPDYIEERLYTIEKIMKKYGSEEKALNKLSQLKDELEKINDSDSELDTAYKEYNRLHNELELSAQKISDSRKNGAKKLCKEISEQLCDLDMPQVDFCVDISRSTNQRGGTKFTPIGFDNVEFLISANAGQQPKPIAKIASGGELSRIMLCLKSSLSGRDMECDTYIYDEVDSGVSGATAQKIGYKLKKSSDKKQVFCVTHLAQIAALADSHYKVKKTTSDGITRSNIYLLDDNQRAEEIARIMGGVEITQQLYKSAKELIDNSKNNS